MKDVDLSSCFNFFYQQICLYLLYIGYLLVVAALKIFSPSPVLCNLFMMYLDVVFSYFLCLEFIDFWGTVSLLLSSNLQNVRPLFLKYSFCDLLALLQGLELYVHDAISSRPTALWRSVNFFPVLPVFHCV